ncbi:helix-turn-helix domain-containing protein [Streptomyces sp. R302]|uniref:helix-turn-helix domain-containing protein n=1 Tax=unclassified Streptomyces TaxID=2593676 RepID=UPI00145FC152|nr:MULTISPECIES: helix-turn-helix domain-containing protein [unclassified Streptomyces]NML55684.1 helix-turn-helix domain-containing protein [Streptomyces sp. R301]NML83974.1 helix-turn-helix domain-containing protein [Streptomyces sp. R302]
MTAIAARRATVARLHAAGHSLRVIAEQVGASKDTIARDLAGIEAAATAAAARTADRQARRRLHRRARPARLRRPQPLRHRRTDPTTDAAPARDTSHAAEARPAPSTSSAAPCLTVPASSTLLRDLATLTRNGVTPEAAIAGAVWTMARAYLTAWERGLYPPTVDPAIVGTQYGPYVPLRRNRLDMIAT